SHAHDGGPAEDHRGYGPAARIRQPRAHCGPRHEHLRGRRLPGRGAHDQAPLPPARRPAARGIAAAALLGALPHHGLTQRVTGTPARAGSLTLTAVVGILPSLTAINAAPDRAAAHVTTQHAERGCMAAPGRTA